MLAANGKRQHRHGLQIASKGVGGNATFGGALGAMCLATIALAAGKSLGVERRVLSGGALGTNRRNQVAVDHATRSCCADRGARRHEGRDRDCLIRYAPRHQPRAPNPGKDELVQSRRYSASRQSLGLNRGHTELLRQYAPVNATSRGSSACEFTSVPASWRRRRPVRRDERSRRPVAAPGYWRRKPTMSIRIINSGSIEGRPTAL
jgi:hypothetical protein